MKFLVTNLNMYKDLHSYYGINREDIMFKIYEQDSMSLKEFEDKKSKGIVDEYDISRRYCIKEFDALEELYKHIREWGKVVIELVEQYLHDGEKFPTITIYDDWYMQEYWYMSLAGKDPVDKRMTV